VKLALDHHYSPTIATRLRELGHDAIAIRERGWQMDADAKLLQQCVDEQRALLTNNAADFLPIVRTWLSEGREHFGLILTSDSSMPRTQATIGSYVRALAALFGDHSAPNAMKGQVVWLSQG
jgi:predicted nuclease of predicted toxin-antitoxin system